MENKRVENQQNINSRIINLAKIRGPILPIHASKEIGQTLLLTGAFLSTLVSDKILKISNLKVGGSPLYYLPGQEAMLEGFIKFLNHKEREAYLMLKEKKVVKEDELSPDLRVAIKNLKDFAQSFSLNSLPGIVFWRYFSLNDEELEKQMEKYKMIQEIPKQLEKPAEKPVIKLEEAKVEEKPIEKKLEPIFEEVKKQIEIKPELKVEVKPETKPVLKLKRKVSRPIKTDKFLEEIKPILASKNLQIVRIEKYDSKEVSLIANQNEKETFVLALNKKRVDESDLLKAFKKAQILKLPYLILSKGEMPKKLKEIMDASKAIDRIEKI